MFALLWKGEIIEDEIATKEDALYLRGEYDLAFGGGVTIICKGAK